MECVIRNGALLKCVLSPGETTIIIPDGVGTIGRRAFYGIQELTSVILPDSVTHIGKAVFAYCKNLSSVTLPRGLKTIGRSAFWECDNLKHILLFLNTSLVLDAPFFQKQNQ